MAKQCMLLAHCDVFERDAVLGLKNGTYSRSELDDRLKKLREPDSPDAPDDSMVFDIMDLAEQCNGELKAEQYWMVPVFMANYGGSENLTVPATPGDDVEFTYVCTCGCVWNNTFDGYCTDTCPECGKDVRPHDVPEEPEF